MKPLDKARAILESKKSSVSWSISSNYNERER